MQPVIAQNVQKYQKFLRQETHQVSHFRRDLLIFQGRRRGGDGIGWDPIRDAAKSHCRAATPTATDDLMVAPGAIADGSFCWTWEPLELWNQLLTYICLHVYIWNTYFFYSILGIRLYIHGVFVPERDLSPSCSKRCHSSASELRIHSDRLTRTDGT